MGIQDDLIDTAEDIGRTLAIEGIAAAAKWIATKVLGDAADDTAREKIARAALDAATEIAWNEAFMAAGGAAILQAQADDIVRRAKLCLEAFTPKGTIAPLGPGGCGAHGHITNGTWEPC